MGTENRITEAKLYLKLVVNSFLLKINSGKNKEKNGGQVIVMRVGVFFLVFFVFYWSNDQVLILITHSLRTFRMN